jgi:hypothetical protein
LFKAKKRKTKNQKLIQLSDLFLKKKKIKGKRPAPRLFEKTTTISKTPTPKILILSYRLPKKVKIKQVSFLK